LNKHPKNVGKCLARIICINFQNW